ANTGSTGYAFPGLAPLLVGASFVMLEDWDPEAGLEMLSRYRCTYATAIPTQMVQLLQLPLERYDLGRLTRFNNAGAPLPPEAAKEIEERIGCRVQTLYGATDGGVPVTTDIADPAEKRRFTVGRRLPGQELKLVDPATGEDVRPGETGEVIWRGANKSYGYLNQPEYDAENWRDGWFRSGDLGVLDEEGYLRIVGRVKDMILRGGVNIFPKEIEDLLIQQPKVAQVVVAGAPDPVLGQRVAAFVVPRDPTSPPALEELNAFLSQRQVARWKHIEQLHVVSSIPLNSGGKVDKPRLLEMVAGERGATA
ncbi:MAG: long-chain fatty acid--CoA ligase, partial [Clostridia bacterium]|nr:long-chain fatty acid--CoA ligase [Clostridia bacterium]